MPTSPVPTFRPAAPGEPATHLHHVRLGITIPIGAYPTFREAFTNGRSDCMLHLVSDGLQQVEIPTLPATDRAAVKVVAHLSNLVAQEG